MDRSMMKDLMGFILQFHAVFKLLYLSKGEIFDLKNTLSRATKLPAVSVGRGIISRHNFFH